MVKRLGSLRGLTAAALAELLFPLIDFLEKKKMKDLKMYLPTHPGAEGQFRVASARMRVAEEEGETGHFPPFLARWMESKGAGGFDDCAPYIGSSDPRFLTTLTDSGTIAYATEGSGSPGGHRFQSKATPTAGDDTILSGVRGLLIAATPSGSEAGYSNSVVFQTQLQLANVSASGIGFAAGLLPPSTSTSPLSTSNAAWTATNGLWFSVTPGGAGLSFSTVYNGGTAHSISTFNLSNGSSPATGAINFSAATDYRLTLTFGQNANGNTWGRVHVAPYTAGQMGWMTNLTSAQLADVASMISLGSVYLSAFLNFEVAGTTQRAGYAQFLSAFCDR